MTAIRFLTIHCSAHPAGRDVTVAQMNAIAMQRFRQRSYHWIVTLDGVAHRNMEDHQRGAHVGGHNTGNIGVCIVGGLAADGKTCENTMNPAQEAALRRIVADYQMRVPGIIIRGHRDWSPDRNGNGKVDRHEWLKCCPSFDVAEWLAAVPAAAATPPPPPAVNLRAGPRALHLMRRHGHTDAQIAAMDATVRAGIGNTPTTPGQFGALLSFALSIGATNFTNSTARLDHIERRAAGPAFMNWRKVGGVDNPALVAQREAERALYENRLADFDLMTGYRP